LPSMAGAPTVESLWKSVQADKKSVQLNAHGSSSDQVTITNTMDGVVTLGLRAPQVAGLKIALDRTELKKGEQAKVTFAWEAAQHPIPPPFRVGVFIEPINLMIPILVQTE